MEKPEYELIAEKMLGMLALPKALKWHLDTIDRLIKNSDPEASLHSKQVIAMIIGSHRL